jgi:hypothetical protein
MSDNNPASFRFLSNEEFQRLSEADKATYVRQAFEELSRLESENHARLLNLGDPGG